MSQEAVVAGGKPEAAGPAGWLANARAVATDRMAIFALVWAILAFWVRPLLLAAHHGEPGAMLQAIRDDHSMVALARVTAVAQWASFAGCLALLMIAHTRFAHAAPAAANSNRGRFATGAAYTVVMCLAYLVFLWEPVSVFTLITHDSFIFFDSSYRILGGQTPSADFPTALGAASLYLPALATWLAGKPAGSVELASVFVAGFLGLACARAGASRLPAWVTAVLIAIIFLVTVPGALLDDWGGESQTIVDRHSEVLSDNLSWAMFYNRWGWTALIPAFLYLAPHRESERPPSLVDIGVFAALLTFLFYLKPTYLAVAMAAAGLYALFNPKPVRTLAVGAGIAAVLTIAIGLWMGNLTAYIHDVLFTAKVSGGRTEGFMGLVRENFVDVLVACAPLALLGATGRLGWKDILVGLFIVASCLFIINQNGQFKHMTAIIAVAAYGVARLHVEGADSRTQMAALGAFLMVAASPLFERNWVLMDQAYAIRREENRPPSDWAHVPALQDVYVAERESLFDRMAAAETTGDRHEELWINGILGRRESLRQGEYMQTVLAGMEDLAAVVQPGDSVATLDMTNPFPFLMGLRAPQGAWLTMHKDRTISEDVHPAPGVLFRDTDHVMIAKFSMVQDTPDLLLEIYGDWLTANYEERAETDFWIRFSRRKAEAG